MSGVVGDTDGRWSGGCLREPEIENLRAARSEVDVRRFDVAMHDALAVRGLQGVGNGECDVNEDRHLDQAASESLLECLAFEQFHRDERWIDADIVDGADIGVVERRRRPRFPLETFQRLRGCGHPARRNLDCHDPVETRVLGPIHLSHPAGTQRADDFVGAEASTGSKGQRVQCTGGAHFW